jgi:hypothetical protein
MQKKSHGKRWGVDSTKKGKKWGDVSLREYFIIFLEKCKVMDNYFILSSRRKGMSHQMAKATFEGDRCQV